MNKHAKVNMAAASVFAAVPLAALSAEPVAFVESIKGGERICEKFMGDTVAPTILVEKDKLRAGDMMRCRNESIALVRFIKTNGELEIGGGDAWYGIGNPAPVPLNSKSNNVPSRGEQRRLGRIGQFVAPDSDTGANAIHMASTRDYGHLFPSPLYFSENGGTAAEERYSFIVPLTWEDILSGRTTFADALIANGSKIPKGADWQRFGEQFAILDRNDNDKSSNESWEEAHEKDLNLKTLIELTLASKNIDYLSINIMVHHGDVTFEGENPQFPEAVSVVKDLPGVRSVRRESPVAELKRKPQSVEVN